MGTRHFVEQRLAKRRVQEAKDIDLRRKIAENNIITGYTKSDNRVEDLRRGRADAAERRDYFRDYSYAQAETDKARRMQITQLEENLSDELARRKAEQQRKDMEKMRICESSEELRALKVNLHMAKVNKERAQQLLEQEVRTEKDRLFEQKVSEVMENERLDHVELEHKLSLEKMKQRERVKVINQQQIATKEAQRDEAMQEYRKEQEQVKELVNKIAEEDFQEVAARDQKKVEARVQMQKFTLEQKVKQEAMEHAEKVENKRIEDFAQAKRQREERLEQERVEAEREKTRVLNKMLGVMEAKNKQAEELELLRNDMHQEELEAAVRRREDGQRKKHMEDREDMKQAYIQQMEVKDAKNRMLKQEEEKIRDQLLKKFAEDDRIEQMNEQKKRMKVQEHKREAERLMQVKREQFEKARQQELADEAKLREEEGQRQAIVEAARIQLLKDHAGELQGFLPKGTFEHAGDLDF